MDLTNEARLEERLRYLDLRPVALIESHLQNDPGGVTCLDHLAGAGAIDRQRFFAEDVLTCSSRGQNRLRMGAGRSRDNASAHVIAFKHRHTSRRMHRPLEYAAQ